MELWLKHSHNIWCRCYKAEKEKSSKYPILKLGIFGLGTRWVNWMNVEHTINCENIGQLHFPVCFYGEGNICTGTTGNLFDHRIQPATEFWNIVF